MRRTKLGGGPRGGPFRALGRWRLLVWRLLRVIDLAGASVAWQQRVILSHGIDTALSKLCIHHATASGIETWHVQVTESAMHILHVIRPPARPPFARPLRAFGFGRGRIRNMVGLWALPAGAEPR